MSQKEIKKLVYERVSAELAGHQLFKKVDELIGQSHRHLCEAEDVMQLILDMIDDDNSTKTHLIRRLELLRKHRELLDDLCTMISGDFDRDMQDRLYSMLYTTEFARTIDDLRKQVSTGNPTVSQENRAKTTKAHQF